jgi:hypothetical protein
MSKPVWTSDINKGVAAATATSSLVEELGRSEVSSGDFLIDYSSVATRMKLVAACPYVSFARAGNGEATSNTSEGICRIANCYIDQASWRCALSAINMPSSPVSHLAVHNCTLKPQYILDLVSMLDSKSIFTSVRLEYIEWDADPEAAATALVPIFSTTSTVSFISLRANRLTDTFLTAASPSLIKNVYLKYLSLSKNLFTDAAISTLVGILKMNISLERISLKENALTGETLGLISDLVLGMVCSAEEDAGFKAVTKSVGDLMKAVKDANKKRKKENKPEIEEVAVPERVIKMGKSDLFIINKQIKSIDVSYNPLCVTSILALRDHAASRAACPAVPDAPRPAVQTREALRNTNEGDDTAATADLPGGFVFTV